MTVMCTLFISDPEFVPKVVLKGSTSQTVSLGWITPNLTDYYHYYNVSVRSRSGRISYKIVELRDDYPDAMVVDLKSGMDYSFKVRNFSIKPSNSQSYKTKFTKV